MEFENAFSKPGKVVDFRENGRGHGKVIGFFFGPNILCDLKTASIVLVIQQKYAPKRLGLQHTWCKFDSCNFIFLPWSEDLFWLFCKVSV